MTLGIGSHLQAKAGTLGDVAQYVAHIDPAVGHQGDACLILARTPNRQDQQERRDEHDINSLLHGCFLPLYHVGDPVGAYRLERIDRNGVLLRGVGKEIFLPVVMRDEGGVYYPLVTEPR